MKKLVNYWEKYLEKTSLSHDLFLAIAVKSFRSNHLIKFMRKFQTFQKFLTVFRSSQIFSEVSEPFQTLGKKNF